MDFFHHLIAGDYNGLVGIIIPLVVMFGTQAFEKRRAAKSLEEEQKRFKEDTESRERQYKANLELQREVNRISIEPFLTFEKDDVKFAFEEDLCKLYIKVRFRNSGNNSALHPQVEKEDILPAKEFEGYEGNVVYHGILFWDYCEEEPIRTQIVRVDGEGEVSLWVQYKNDSRDASDNGRSILNSGGDRFEFSVLFWDLNDHKYRQKFRIWHSINSYPVGDRAKLERWEIDAPVLIWD